MTVEFIRSMVARVVDVCIILVALIKRTAKSITLTKALEMLKEELV
jgi:hypothetical protein